MRLRSRLASIECTGSTDGLSKRVRFRATMITNSCHTRCYLTLASHRPFWNALLVAQSKDLVAFFDFARNDRIGAREFYL